MFGFVLDTAPIWITHTGIPNPPTPASLVWGLPSNRSSCSHQRSELEQAVAERTPGRRATLTEMNSVFPRYGLISRGNLYRESLVGSRTAAVRMSDWANALFLVVFLRCCALEGIVKSPKPKHEEQRFERKSSACRKKVAHLTAVPLRNTG